MIEIAIPGGDRLRLAHALLDFNGTLAHDGMLIGGVAERLRSLATKLEIHVVTADTAGTAASALAELPVSLAIMPPRFQAAAKENELERLGRGQTVAIGNGRNDLLLVNWEDRNPFRFRLQKEGGELGPENYFAFPPIRSYWADNLEEKGRTEVITIAQNSGRAQISEFARKPSESLSGAFHRGQFQVMPLNKTEKARRGLLWADINGDRLPDLLVADEIVLSTSEAVANAIEHAETPAQQTVEIEASLRGRDEVVIVVQDFGSWREPTGATDRGRGLVLIRALMDSVDIETAPRGTRVTMHRRLTPATSAR